MALNKTLKEQLLKKRAALKPSQRRIGRPPRWIYPAGIEQEYVSALKLVVAGWRKKVSEIIVPHLESWIDERDKSTRQDAWQTNAARLVSSLNVAFDTSLKAVKFKAANIGQKTSKWNDTQWQKVMRGVVGVELFASEPWLSGALTDWTTQNVGLIKKLSAETAAQVQEVIETGIRAGERSRTISQRLLGSTSLKPLDTTDEESVMRKTRNRARLIARDQVGKLNGELQQQRQADLGIERYIWRTVGDNAVRPSHAAMDGETCRWDDPTVYLSGSRWANRSSIGGVEEHPGQDYQCRCSADADFSEIVTELE